MNMDLREVNSIIVHTDVVRCGILVISLGESVDQEEEIMDVSGEQHEHEHWEPEKIHYEYYSGEPQDEDLNQKGRGLFFPFCK